MTVTVILWEFSDQADRIIEARIPDLIFIDIENSKCQVISYDTSVDAKETETGENYQDLSWEMKNRNVELIPVIMRSLGTPPRKMRKRLRKIGIRTKIADPQKTAIICSMEYLKNS